MACEPGQYQYCAPDDGMRCRNSCRGHEREIVAACDPNHSIRLFAEPPTRRWDLASRARGELAVWRDRARSKRTAFCTCSFGRRRSRTPRSPRRAASGMTASGKMAHDDGFVAYTWRLFWLKP